MRYICAYLLCSFWLLVSSSDVLGQPHLDTARKYVGTVERGNNRGDLVDAWNRAVRAPLGSPYCASFVSHCLSRGGARSPRVRSAWSRAFVTPAAIPAAHVLTGKYAVKPGDIIVWRRSATAGHIGFASKNWVRGKGETIEANTSSGIAGSQWDGGGVYTRHRTVNLYNHFRITHFVPVGY